MGYTSSADPMSNLINNLNFPSPQSAMDFALKRGWDYEFPDFATLIFSDNGDIYDPSSGVPLRSPSGSLNLDHPMVVKGKGGSPELRETYTSYKVPPYFDDDIVDLHGSHATKISPHWPAGDKHYRKERDNADDYGENFLPKAVKHHLKTEKMNADYYARDESGASHYFRPLKYHGDGIVRQHGPNQDPTGEEIKEDVEGWRSRR